MAEIMKEKNPECTLCRRYGLEKGDSLYQVYYPDSGISFDEIRDIRYCPLCGKKLKEDNTQPDEVQEDEAPDCSDCKHYRYFIGEAYCDKNKSEYPVHADLCSDFTHE